MLIQHLAAKTKVFSQVILISGCIFSILVMIHYSFSKINTHYNSLPTKRKILEHEKEMIIFPHAKKKKTQD